MEKKAFSCMRDGLVIRGHVFMPDGGAMSDGDVKHDSEPKATVILSHAFGSSEAETMPYAEHLTANGFCCFTYNFCGGSLGPDIEGIEKSDGDFSQMTIESEMADLCAVMEYAKAQSFVDPRNMILVGGSQGGFISARVASKYPEGIKLLVMLYPALCIPQDANSGQMLFFSFDPNNVPDFIENPAMPGLRLNGEYVKQSQKIDIYGEIKAFPGKVVIMHGTDDEVVEFSYAQKVVEARPDAELVTMDGATHGFRGDYQNIAKDYLLKAALGEV